MNIRQLRRPPMRDTVLNTRWKTNWLARLLTPQGPLACIVEDISAEGARLRIGRAPLQEGEVSLIVTDTAAIAAHVAWRRGGLVGLALAEDQPQVTALVVQAASANAPQPQGSRG
jgi:hypothetical protein